MNERMILKTMRTRLAVQLPLTRAMSPDAWWSTPLYSTKSSLDPVPDARLDVVQANSAPGDEQRLAFQPAAKYAPIMDAVYKALMHRSASSPCLRLLALF